MKEALDINHRTVRINRDDETDPSPVVIFTDPDDRVREYVDANGYLGGQVLRETYWWFPVGDVIATGGVTRTALVNGLEITNESGTVIEIDEPAGPGADRTYPTLDIQNNNVITNVANCVHTAGAAARQFLVSDLDNLVFVMDWVASVSAVGGNNVGVFMGMHSDADDLTTTYEDPTARSFAMFEKQSGDTNWQASVGDGAAGTSNDTGTPPVMSVDQSFRLEYHGINTPLGVTNGFATVRFFIDGTKEDEIADANVPTGVIKLGISFRVRSGSPGPVGNFDLRVSPIKVAWNMKLNADIPA